MKVAHLDPLDPVVLPDPLAVLVALAALVEDLDARVVVRHGGREERVEEGGPDLAGGAEEGDRVERVRHGGFKGVV